MSDWKRLVARLEGHDDLFLDLIRIYLGVGLFVKGVWFIGHRDHLVDLIAGSGTYWFVPALVAHLVILAHLFGGILVALGLATRLGAGIQIPVLAGAVLRVHLPKLADITERGNLEFSALVLFLLVLVFLRGGGPLSLDRRMGRGRG